MAKIAKVGVYGPQTRKLQRRLAYEATSLTWKVAEVYRYLGSRTNDNPNLKDIQIATFMETPDRAYNKVPVCVNIWFDPAPEQVADFSQYGIIDPIGGEQIVKMHINSYEEIGRPIIVGDVLEIPFFRYENTEALWEVVDVDHSQEYEKYYSVLKMNVLKDSRETREVPKSRSISPTLDDIVDGHTQEANDYVPSNGLDDSVIDNGETSDFGGPYERDDEPRRSFLDELDGEL